MVFLRVLLVILSLITNSGSGSLTTLIKLRRSQFRRWGPLPMEHDVMVYPTDPRVRTAASTVRGAALAVKLSGSNSVSTHSWARKRAYRRARQRAALNGGTWYRGVWRSAASLGTSALDVSTQTPSSSRRCPSMQGRRQRLKVLSYNVGGMSADLYDVFHIWLCKQQCADIVLLQEVHWGLGRGETQWTKDGWHYVVSASSDTRYAGVCICVSAKLARPSDIDYQVWHPGRLLHVRVHGRSIPIDIVCAYQWVQQYHAGHSSTRYRSQFWDKLDRMLGTLPRRNVLVCGGDMNAVLRPLGAHVGHGIHSTARTPDDDLLNILQVHDLCVLNTWRSARPHACTTFYFADTKSQIDFVITRRSTTDPQARLSGPVSLDLAPWRQGPKHWPVQASIPLIGCWVLSVRESRPTYTYSLKALRACPEAQPPYWETFCEGVQAAIAALPEDASLANLNDRVLGVCACFFPPEVRKAHPNAIRPEAKSAVARMWESYREWRSGKWRAARGRLFQAWRKYADFKAASKHLRKVSVQARRQRIYAIIDRAAQAASKDQMNELYNVTRILAPRQRRERVRVRALNGAMLTPYGQFQEIDKYFRTAFAAPEPFRFSSPASAPDVTDVALISAIKRLQPRKSVPAGSVPPEVWKGCTSAFATRLAGAYRAGVQSNPSILPTQITDCSLTLIPKPGKSSRLPKDLRPIGIQDPASKLIARALRDQLAPQVSQLLGSTPQYAYCEGKGIDQAIFRVITHCQTTRNRLQEGTLSVHARRAGRTSSTCYGSIMVGIDMSRAFDNLTRAVLLRSLRFAGVSEQLQRILLEIHCACQYEIKYLQFSSHFNMERGVRQGCAISPLLYSLFTAWLLAELKGRTSDCWVDNLVTCFADDTHLAWDIEQPSDLDFVCRSLRATFQLLKECNMVVNSDKSSVILGLRGNHAKRWIRTHIVARAGKRCLNFGIPGDPLCIPMVDSFVYLGVVVSYRQFEQQTLQHRIQAASANRARLNKVLHSKQLAVRRRVCLYVSCVRSSLMYGLHAVGLTESVLRKLESVDARHLRSVARSPVHLTHESNTALRKRLKVASPMQALAASLEKRINTCADNSFQEVLRNLRSLLLERISIGEEALPMEAFCLALPLRGSHARTVVCTLTACVP